MRFGPEPLGDHLNGAISAHSLKLPDRTVPKGVVLDDALIEAIRTAGHETVVVARLEAGDHPEAEAAQALAACLAAPHLRIGSVVHGRVNLFAEADGLLRLDAAAIGALNGIDEAITLATLADATRVVAGDMLATLKIIPFAVTDIAMTQAMALMRRSDLLTIKPFRSLRVGLVLTRLPHLKDAAVRHTIETTGQRVAARRGSLIAPIETAHTIAAITQAIGTLLDQGAELLLIAGASAVTDRQDVAPAAIVASFGRIERFGMPVDPGNLLCFGTIGAIPAIVLPGCARSPKLNGIDLVLDRVFAGETIDAATIAGMGVGGLLKDFAPRPAPRIPRQTPKAVPRVAAIVLAAGRSSRAAPANKLLARLPDGRALVAATVDHALASRANPVIIVTGHQADDIRTALTGRAVTFVHAPHFAQGMAETLKAGIRALDDSVTAALICLGDMPLVDAAALNRLIASYDPDEGRTIIVPTHRGRRGNPILWDRQFFAAFMTIEGDVGARHLLISNADFVAEVPMDDETILNDFDTKDALTALMDRL